MIQFNLLPDVKQEYIKAQSLKRLMVTISFLASAGSLVILLLIASTVFVVQRKAMNDLNDSIHTDSQTLRNTPNITDILTVQSQLNSLSTLHLQKPVASRIFGYLSQLTPTQATISDLSIDYTVNTINVSGNAPSLDVVNTFIDGLKFTNYSVAGVSGSKPAFSSVVLSSFSRSANTATYAISMSFDPTIFNVADDVTLTVGNQNAPAQQPSIIFKKAS